MDIFKSCHEQSGDDNQLLMRSAHNQPQFQDIPSNSQIVQSKFNKKFKGSTIFIDENNKRTELPVKKPDEPVALWKIISKFIGQDFTRVSMPVIMNEPLGALQKMAEMMCENSQLLIKAASTDDPVKRLAYCITAQMVFLSASKIRKRKPFNPMLGETYELVTEDFRFIAEKTSHTQRQVTSCYMEGKDFTFLLSTCPVPKFSLNGGRGMVKIETGGSFDIHFDKYDEDISLTKTTILAKNIIFGGLYIDAEGIVEAVNHKTGERFEIVYYPK